MPNWCECMINVWGEIEELSQTLDKAKSKGLCESVIPLAEDANPYETWGTKWEVELEEVELHTEDDGRGRLVFDFRSAWEPPVHVMKKLAEQFEVEAWFVIKGESVGQVVRMGPRPPYTRYGQMLAISPTSRNKSIKLSLADSSFGLKTNWNMTNSTPTTDTGPNQSK